MPSITINLSAADATRVQAILPTGVTAKQYIIEFLIEQVEYHEVGVQTQAAQNQITTYVDNYVGIAPT